MESSLCSNNTIDILEESKEKRPSEYKTHLLWWILFLCMLFLLGAIPVSNIPVSFISVNVGPFVLFPVGVISSGPQVISSLMIFLHPIPY
jgi:hypothetical protein